jgi:hypothetical protein
MLHSSAVRSSDPHTTQSLQRPVSVVHPKRHMLWPPRGWVLKSTESHLARSSCNPRKYAEHAFAAACSKMCKCGHQPCIATASFSTAIRSRPSWGWASRPPRREPDFSASSRGAGGRAKRSYLRAGQCLGFGWGCLRQPPTKYFLLRRHTGGCNVRSRRRVALMPCVSRASVTMLGEEMCLLVRSDIHR